MAFPFKTGGDFYNCEAQRMRLHNLGANPTETATGLMYFNTGTSNLGKHAVVHDGTNFKALAFVDEIATNTAFTELANRVLTIEKALGEDTANVIDTWEEIQNFLKDIDDNDANLMTMLNDKLSLSQGGVMTGTIKVGTYDAFGQTGGNFYLGTPAYPLLLRSNGTTTINGNNLIHKGNYATEIGDYYLKSSGGTMSNTNLVTNLNADLLDGYHVSIYNNKPYGTIPLLNDKGFMDVGNHFEFHYDNTTGSDYSTILRCTGNYGNEVNLPSKSGTLALLTDNVASASKWETPRTITLTGSVTGSVSIDGSDNVSLVTTTNHTHTFTSLTDKPTTISGYGITDAYTASTIDSKLSGYLSISGGTLTGTLTLPNIDITDKVSKLPSHYYHHLYSDADNSVYEYFGTQDDVDKVTYGRFRFFNGSGSYRTLVIGGDGTFMWDGRDVLTTSNFNSYAPKLDGTGASGTWGIDISGNAATATNADKLDGYHASSFVFHSIDIKTFGSKAILGYAYTKGGWITNGPAMTFGDAQYYLQFQYVYDASFEPYIRTHCPENGYSSWKQLAYLTSNVASATKLANPRTIWGQSFDGTGNVSGALTGVTDITAIGHAKVNSLKTKNICIECDSNGNTDSRASEINDYEGPLYIQHNTPNNCFICSGGGNVGIGTTNPQYRLDVAGTGRFTGAVTMASTLMVGGNITPNTNNAHSLGTSSYQWSHLYAVGATLSGTLGVSGATTLGSTLSVSGAATLSDAVTIKGDLVVEGNIIGKKEVSAGGAGQEGESGAGGGAEVISQTLASGASTYSITNTIKRTDIAVSLYEWNASGNSWDMCLADISVTNSTITVTFGSATNVNHKLVAVG